ncbi:hypothetical protein ABZT04_25355 [Streptomyces sp. NPDC005492]|uniref:hypothetical protein n=1 Tax=Streptomyces sp. NPDC005492 TaxID=3156883 RepID=UPI0033A9614E
MTLGYAAGDHIGTLYPAIQRYELYLLAAAGVILAAVVARHLLRRRATHATRTPSAPDDQDTPAP